MAVVSDELCDTDDQPPPQDGVQSDPGGREDPPGAREQGQTPECPSPLSSVSKAGLCLESLVIIAWWSPCPCCSLGRRWCSRIWTHQGHHRRRDLDTTWGAPAPHSPQTNPALKEEMLRWGGDERSRGQHRASTCGSGEPLPGLPAACNVSLVPLTPHALCSAPSGAEFSPWGTICLLGWSTNSAGGASGKASCS